MLTEVSGALDAAAHVKNLIAALSSVARSSRRDAETADFNRKLMELSEASLVAHEKITALTVLVKHLEDEKAHLLNWSGERERYALHEVATGVFAYVARNAMGDPQGTQKLCANCFDRMIKSTLQQSGGVIYRIIHLTCSYCETKLSFAAYKPLIPPDFPKD